MPYQEEESSEFTHDGRRYNLNAALRMADPTVKMHDVSDLEWVLPYDTPDEERVAKADVTAPILIAKDRDGRNTAVDGLHRLTKAKRLGLKQLPANYVNLKREGEPWKFKGQDAPIWERGEEQPRPDTDPEGKTRGVLKRLLHKARKKREYVALRYQKDHGGEVKDYIVAPYALKKIRAARTG